MNEETQQRDYRTHPLTAEECKAIIDERFKDKVTK